ncbi:MAG: hypothetical protein RBS28_12565 [Rhodocyclaceae bacterium]|jgi:hypothetical protein|nr:hypothetical protein [Rhodocyclaceae bacterium]
MRLPAGKKIFPFVLSFWLSGLVAVSSCNAGAPIGRQMVIHKVQELGLEIWTEVEPAWETRLDKSAGAPTFIAETPASTYPPAGMTWTVPGQQFTAQEFPTAAQGAVYQAAINYGLPAAQAKALPLKTARYGDLNGYESTFSASAGGEPVDVKVFFGHRPGKPAVAMQVFTQKDKLPHISENIRRSWTHIRYLAP